MITSAQLRAARALLGIDQRDLAELSDLSVPTIQRMEASDGVIRGNVNSLMKLVGALDVAGIELIGEGWPQFRQRPRRAAQGRSKCWDGSAKTGARCQSPRGGTLSAMAAIAGLSCVGALLGIAVLAVLAGRARGATLAVYSASLVVSLAGLFFALHQLLLGTAAPEVTLPLGLPWVGAHFRVDALAAFFLTVVNLGGASASLYGIGYGRHEHEPLRVLPFFPAFLAGMNLVVLAADAFSFLVAWEFMSLASWALVMAHHKEEGNTEAGYVYIVMASIGTLALLLAFGLLAGPDGGYAFETIRAHQISPLSPGFVLGLALFGAGSKAGLVPLHVWLPLAHPAAPSHVSALMSGVMTKVAIYGFIRIVFDLLGPAAVVVGRSDSGRRRRHGGARHPLCPDAERSQARARL